MNDLFDKIELEEKPVLSLESVLRQLNRVIQQEYTIANDTLLIPTLSYKDNEVQCCLQAVLVNFSEAHIMFHELAANHFDLLNVLADKFELQYTTSRISDVITLDADITDLKSTIVIAKQFVFFTYKAGRKVELFISDGPVSYNSYNIVDFTNRKHRKTFDKFINKLTEEINTLVSLDKPLTPDDIEINTYSLLNNGKF